MVEFPSPSDERPAQVELRWDRIRAARHKLAAGMYDSPEILEAALGKFLAAHNSGQLEKRSGGPDGPGTSSY